jgi:exodeoxyribonuclease VII small subunit
MESVKSPTFEEAIDQLEKIVHQMEAGQLPLAESLAAYERGIGLVKQCHQMLEQGEQKIIELAGVDENGQPCLQPFLDKTG